MKKIAMFLFFLLFIEAITFSQTSGTAPSKEKVSQAAQLLGVSESDLQTWINSKFISVPAGIPNITAVKLYQDYQTSQLNSDRTYKDKQIRVTGVVAKIEEDYDFKGKKRYCLKFRIDGISSTVKVFFDDSDIDPLYNIKVGQTISVLGTVMGLSAGNVHIDHGKIL
jgi:hypothetical protein